MKEAKGDSEMAYYVIFNTSRAAIFRLQRKQSSALFSTRCDVTFCWMILTQKSAESLSPLPPVLHHQYTLLITSLTKAKIFSFFTE